MKGRGKKPPGRAYLGLAPLPPEVAAALQAQVERLKEALQHQPDLETLKEMISPRPQDLLWDLHLLKALGALPHPAIPPLLAALFSRARDRQRAKAVKRALHLLKTRGVAVPRELLPREEAPRPRLGGPSQAFVSPIFGNGERYIILEGPKEILGGNFLVCRISDQEGFRECLLLTLKRQQQEEFWQHFRDQGLADWAKAPSTYAAALLEEAYGLNPKAEAASQYAALRERLARHWRLPETGPVPEALLPPLSPAEKGRLLEHSRMLALDPLFHYWLPSLEELKPWFTRLKETQNSPLVLTDQQRQLRLASVVEEAVRALYPPESRQNWSRRLLSMAYYLDLQGRQEDARAAQAAAADLAEASRGPLAGENLFLLSLLQQALRLAQDLEKGREAEAPSGLVIPPAQQPLIIRR